MEQQKFSKYEIARILGARALQIAMDAPLLIKISKEKLEEMQYDSIRIAEYEFTEGVLPISINRPTPRKHADNKLGAVKEDKASEEELIAKAQEVEKEIAEDAKQFGLVNESDIDDEATSDDGNSEEN